MTVTINSLQFELPINAPNVPIGAVSIQIKSQFSNTDLINQEAAITESNERYSVVSVTLAEDISAKHYNGIYEYTVYSNENIYDTGLLKITTEPGGSTGTVAYTSNNENREAQVVYRPSYE